MTKVIAAIVGAVLGPAIVFAIVVLLYQAFRPGGTASWDMGTPMMTLAAFLPAAVIGSTGGVLVARALDAGRAQSAVIAGAVTLVILVAIPIYILVLPYLPRAPFKPATADQRTAWASQRTSVDEPQGAGLASQLEGCWRRTPLGDPLSVLNDASCVTLRRAWYGQGADSLAALGAYIAGDNGWRWDADAGASPPRALVFPDPLLPWKGPVFEVRPYQVLRREQPGAPAFVTDSTLPKLVAFQRCLAGWTRSARELGRWDGDGRTLPSLLEQQDLGEGCARVRIEDRPEDPLGLWVLSVMGGGLPYPWRVEYRARIGEAQVPFSLAFSINGTGFLADEYGEWHMRHGAPAGPGDPAPPDCLMDPAIPCA